ncbi:glycosyl transferase [Sulfitobacter sp. JL08]|uniref:glycosyltransferase n=1 Tax=Sulfitobacter sp. JL08 TaxID=2070369 RepID=UPI000E0BEE0F|nr:glycosyltransferase [Sulfitobacter sp. JL08]AXI54060.1 glycosyl transferase [Sulfitobacter sp. JL08]
MSDLRLRLGHSPLAYRTKARSARVPLGQILVNAGVISHRQLIHALNQQLHLGAPLGAVLAAEGLVDEKLILDCVALQHDARRVDLALDPPDYRLFGLRPCAFWARHQVVPWLRLGDTLFVATSRPDSLKSLRLALEPEIGAILPVVAAPQDIATCLSATIGPALARRAETLVKETESCRTWNWRTHPRRNWIGAAGVACLTLALLAPLYALTVITGIAVFTLLLSTGLKLATFLRQTKPHTAAYSPPTLADSTRLKLPCVSVMVPLLREHEITNALIARLSRLTYPKALLDVVLVLEADDNVTRDTLAHTVLPAWMRVIEVPSTGTLTTKPRALNYALDFCRGSIIGIWDAEDAPAPDQIETVVHYLDEAPPEVACVQGVLDYYNARDNWMSRCFAIEYATWWRVIMPGIARLGLIIPLGGTTVFFRRDVLEKLRGWDAHNVTEDADLGFRLARYGYRTDLIRTVTREEATCRPWPWIRQRSRWLKGFMVTYAVHMRQPRVLLSEIGAYKFWGFQVFFICALSQFLLAPVLWSFWLVPFGVSHPVATVLGTSATTVLAVLFILCEVSAMIIAGYAVRGRAHRHLMAWVPTLALYFPMATLAAYKAVYELIRKPFFWDKTQHGHSLNGGGGD